MNDELSMRGLIIKAQETTNYLLRKWKLIALFILLGAIAGLAASFIVKVKYKAVLTFVMEDSKNGSFSAYSSIASQFGIQLPDASSTSGVFSGDNIMGFLQSRTLIERTLLTPTTINGKQLTLAEHYVNFNNLRSQYKGKPGLENISFPVGLSRSKYTLQQDSILYTLYKRIYLSDLKVDKPDKKLSFVEVDVTTPNEQFSKVFAENLVDEALSFYVDAKMSRSRRNVNNLQKRADSILMLLNQRTYTTAQIQDINLNPARKVATVGAELALRDKGILQTMYAEVERNLEVSKATMEQEAPLIQIVDTPIYPLERKKVGKGMGLIVGGFLGGFVIIVFLIVRMLYNDLLSK